MPRARGRLSLFSIPRSLNADTEDAQTEEEHTVQPIQLGGDSQNFLRKFVRFFLTLGLKILRF